MKKYIIGIVMTMVLGITNAMAHPGDNRGGRPAPPRKEVVVVKEHCKKCDKHYDKKHGRHNDRKCRDDVYRYSEKTPAKRPARPVPPPAPARTWRGTPMFSLNVTIP